ncbi:BREX-4 system phosphatase PglZ [Thermovenabulum sp.]|uniref:BREX-4 system phosphatase PglZ n=1 Tax=Thermovenabulum sp. TaxID=3100335 RepID=UPI003C7C8779
MLFFTSVEDLITSLREEYKKGERFASRFILINGSKTWEEFLFKMKYEVDKTIKLSEFCYDQDLFPDITLLEEKLKNESNVTKKILLIPVGEYLRLDSKSYFFHTIAEWPSNKVRRIYIPILGADDFFFNKINNIGRYRAKELPEIYYLSGEGETKVIIAPFSKKIKDYQCVQGIKNYLQLWEEKSEENIWLTTQFAPYLKAEQNNKYFHLYIFNSSYDYIKNNLKLENLEKTWGTEKEWDWLAENIKEDDNLDILAARLLKIADYDENLLFSLWKEFNQNERWLLWLWNKIRSLKGTYLNYVNKINKEFNNFYFDVVMTIFNISKSEKSIKIIKERKELLKKLNVTFLPNIFWDYYNKLNDPIEKISVLTDITEKEKEEIINNLREILLNKNYLNLKNEWYKLIEILYPELIWYLEQINMGDDFADEYFYNYKYCRIKDKADENLKNLIKKWAYEKILWKYHSRYELIEKYRKMGAKIFWIDAMGVEWISLLIKLIESRCDCRSEIFLAKSCLPTITEVNQEWKDDEKVERSLDDIAHHYTYEFPKSFIKFINAIKEISENIITLISNYDLVVVTSDHGLTRFAGTEDIKINIPKGSEVKPPGRFAEIVEETNFEKNDSWIIYNNKIILLDHSKFKTSGSISGEVHGGASPEEFLVPVLVFSKKDNSKKLEMKIEYQLISDKVKLNHKNEGSLMIKLNNHVNNLELKILGELIKGYTKDGYIWIFNINNFEAGKYEGTLYVNKSKIGQLKFDLVKGIIEEDLGI